MPRATYVVYWLQVINTIVLITCEHYYRVSLSEHLGKHERTHSIKGEKSL